jgi:3-phosphoshikimate 1-carboxyvinyltransferase
MKCRRPETFPNEVTLSLPAGKSQANRYLILNYLSGGPLPPIQALPPSDDVQGLRRALCGTCGVVDVGMAGTAARFLLAALAFTPGERILDGAPRLRERPLFPLIEALRGLGADIKTLTEKSLPIWICGVKPTAQEITISADISSQFISALLMVGTRFPEGLRIHLTGEQVSSSYIDLTIEAITQFGGKVEIHSQEYKVLPGLNTQSIFPFIEPDWSSVGPWFMVAALAKISFFFPRLPFPSLQPDAKLHHWAPIFGLAFYSEKGGLWLKPVEESNKPIQLNLIEAPDLAPYLVLLAAAQNRPFQFTGLQTLAHKESNRIDALRFLLHRFGIDAQYDGISLEKKGGTFAPPSDQGLPVFNDHRMAMALAPLTFLVNELTIDDPEVVTKSYPHFWEDLKKTGMILKASNA